MVAVPNVFPFQEADGMCGNMRFFKASDHQLFVFMADKHFGIFTLVGSMWKAIKIAFVGDGVVF